MAVRIRIVAPLQGISIEDALEPAIKALKSKAVVIDCVTPKTQRKGRRARSRSSGRRKEMVGEAVVLLECTDDIPKALKILEEAGIYVSC